MYDQFDDEVDQYVSRHAGIIRRISVVLLWSAVCMLAAYVAAKL